MPQYQPEPPRSGPGKKWYVIAFVVLVIFVVPSLLGFLEGLDGITDGLIRVTVPGDTEVTLEEGDYTVFYEWQGEINGESFSTSSEFPGMEATVFDDDGTEIPVTSSTGDFEYSWGGHSGFSVGEVDIPADGDYVFSAQHFDPANTQEYTLALGKDLAKSTVLLVLGIVGMVGGAFIAFVIWLIVIILRSRAKRRMRAAGYTT
jgi:hypothetical protein